MNAHEFYSRFSLFFKKKDFIYLFEGERERGREKAHKWGGGAEGEREADFPLSREPNSGLDPRTLRWWPELKADWATQAPQRSTLNYNFFILVSNADAKSIWLNLHEPCFLSPNQSLWNIILNPLNLLKPSLAPSASRIKI